MSSWLSIFGRKLVRFKTDFRVFLRIMMAMNAARIDLSGS
jgi:hypothetical protein